MCSHKRYELTSNQPYFNHLDFITNVQANMRFHFSLATLPVQFHESVQDTILLIVSGLQDCGHGVTIDNEKVKVDGSAINLMLEHFDEEAAASVVATKLQKGDDFPLGIIFTENLTDQNVMAGNFASRTDNFKRVAEVADFLWYFIPGTDENISVISPSKCFFFEVGYSDRFALAPIQEVRDIDFLLPGLTYPRRKPILEKLFALGYQVRSTDLTTPAYIYHNLIGRSKIILDIRRFEDTINMSTIRVCNGATNGITVIAEKFDTSKLGELYDYTITTNYSNFVDCCVDTIEKLDPIEIGIKHKKMFMQNRPLKLYVEKLLTKDIFGPFENA